MPAFAQFAPQVAAGNRFPGAPGRPELPRDPGNQQKFLAQSLDARREQMRGMRAQSEASKQQKTEAIMDIAPAAVEALLRQHGYPRLIHGHTHRPAQHLHQVDGHACERWVLNDWYDSGGYLRCDAAGCTAVLA